jgi:hypothetical protein
MFGNEPKNTQRSRAGGTVGKTTKRGAERVNLKGAFTLLSANAIAVAKLQHVAGLSSRDGGSATAIFICV